MWFRRSPEQKSSLTTKLILLFLFASIYPFSLITYMGYTAMRDVVRRGTLDELRTLAVAAESAFVAQLEGRRAALLEAASALAGLENSPESLSSSLEAWKPWLGAKELRIVSDSKAAGMPVGPESAGAKSVRLEILPRGDAWQAWAPIGDKTFLVARWPLDEMTRLWAGLTGGSAGSMVSLVGPQGKIAVDSGGLAQGRIVSSGVLSRLRDGTLGDLAYRNALGRLVLGAASGKEISRLFGSPWTVIVEQDASFAFRPVELLRDTVMRFGLVMLILFTVIAVLFGRTIMKPIRALTEGARVIGRGQLDHRLSVKADDEIGLLAREFNAMAAELQESYASLEDKIKRATGDLRDHMEKLAEEKDKIDGILRSVTDGIIVTDRSHRLILANPAAETLFGFKLEEAVGGDVQATLGSEPVRAVMGRLLDEPEAEASEEVEFTPPGTDRTRVFMAHKAAVHDHRGETLGAVTLFNDVTPFRELDRMKSEFLSMASHELRTPLTSIQGFSELLIVKQLDKEKQETYLGYINTQSKRLASLISDFLDVARIEAGRGFELVVEPLELEPLVRSMVEIFDSGNIPHSFEVDVEEGLPKVEADRQKVEQVFQNLLGNAVKYSPDGGVVRVSAALRQGAVLIEVADEGVGMTPEQVEKIFDKFFRADASSGAVEGTGLGMFIVKHIVEAHKGAIKVESEVGRGTRVCFSLPCPEAKGPLMPDWALCEPSSRRTV